MKPILVATDFSSASLNAVRYAAALALETDSKLLLFHATHLPVVNDSYYDIGFTLEELQATDKERMNKLNDQLRKKFGESLKLEKEVKIGLAIDLIREKIEKGDISLVVMGISSLGKVYEWVFGSTSTDAAGQLGCPVIIVPEKARYRGLKKIAFSFDQKQIPMGTGLRVIKALKETYESTVHYVHVLSDDYPEKNISTLQPALKVFGDKSPKVHFIAPSKHQPELALEDWIRRNRANALVMISRKHSLLWFLFHERKTKNMAFRSKVPVIVLSEKK